MTSRDNDVARSPADLLFETERFNISKVQDHFINPCCFGEDLAGWLQQKLTERGISASRPGQEDWGWYLFVQHNGAHYFVGVGGNRREGAAPDSNAGEWRIMIEKKRPFWDKLRGRNRMTGEEPIRSIIESILREQDDVHNLHWERP